MERVPKASHESGPMLSTYLSDSENHEVTSPSYTRRVLAIALNAFLGGSVEENETKFGIFRM